MCDLNGPFRLCTCSSDIDHTKLHYVTEGITPKPDFSSKK